MLIFLPCCNSLAVILININNGTLTFLLRDRPSLNYKATVACWNDLCQITLAQIVAFNRRRGGEAERMMISAYCSDSIENVNEAVTACLSRMEMALCKEFCTVHVEGKRGRKVPVLLTRRARCQIACLLELCHGRVCREQVCLCKKKFVAANTQQRQPPKICKRMWCQECYCFDKHEAQKTRSNHVTDVVSTCEVNIAFYTKVK